MNKYFSGEMLLGDDFSQQPIAEWYADEREGYANLGAGRRSDYKYVYHALNELHGFRFLPQKEFTHVLGFGSAYGDELLPLIDRIKKITIIEPSDAFVNTEICNIPTRYVKPEVTGRIPFPDGTFDLITCLGVLHHIPNVSYVVSELARTLVKGGNLVIREPIVSMGDWRRARPGLTARERGIPLNLMRRALRESGLLTVRETLCDFALSRYVLRPFVNNVFDSRWSTRIDAVLASAFKWNLRYHAVNDWQRIRPASACFVVIK